MRIHRDLSCMGESCMLKKYLGESIMCACLRNTWERVSCVHA